MSPPRQWSLLAPVPPPTRPPAHRPVRAGGLLGYLDPIGVRPGERLRIHLSAPAAHRISVVRLGRSAVLDPGRDDAADRAEAEELAAVDRPQASRHDLYPGSYARVDAKGLRRPATVAAWVRLWRPPSIVEAWSWAAVAADMDFHRRCSWALAVDGEGRPGCYFGDGGRHDRRWWTFGPTLAGRLGRWIHLAATVEGTRARLWVDGMPVAEGEAAPAAPDPSGAPVLLGAAVENGVLDHLIDADLSCVLLLTSPLPARDVVRLAEDRALSAPGELGLEHVEAYWPLRERNGDRLADASGHGRDAVAVNRPALGIPGPSASLAIGRPGYRPQEDATRGGAVRFASDDLVDCGWPCAAEVPIPADADSGTYAVLVALAGGGDSLELPFVVVRTAPRRPGAVALLFPTFTWLAYARRPTDDVVVPGLTSSFYTRHLAGRLFFHLGLRVPLPRAKPFAHATHLPAATLQQHLVRPERLAEAWLAREGYAYECITDVELDREPELLRRFAALAIVGHSEYWSQRMRDGLADYLAAGGSVLNLSGNTLYWRVTYDAGARTVESRKTSRPGEGDAWLVPDEWGERWHEDGSPGGTWSLLGRPASELLGVETLGWIDSGDPTAFAPLVVLATDHPLWRAPEPVPLEPGGRLGIRSRDGAAVSGYEMDGLPEAVGMPPLAREGLVHLAHADQGPRYIAHMTEDPSYGMDLLYWERPQGGRVFSAGSVGWTGALAVDPGVQALTRNVLSRFGVTREDPRPK